MNNIELLCLSFCVVACVSAYSENDIRNQTEQNDSLSCSEFAKPLNTITESHAASGIAVLKTIIALPEEEIDLATAQFIIENQINPDIDINHYLNQLDVLTRRIQQMPQYGESQFEKMGAILVYFYTPGVWNNFLPYSYDLDDPLGKKNPRLGHITYFMDTKKGNCSSMPTLITLLGQRLGINISLAVAPMHLFARFTEDSGQITNIEATSGELLSDANYIRAFNIDPNAVNHGLYVQSLTRKQTLSVMFRDVSRLYARNHLFEYAEQVADWMLELYPKHVDAMIHKGNIHYIKSQKLLYESTIDGKPLTEPVKRQLNLLTLKNLGWYERAEGIGWREPPPNYEQEYLESIERIKTQRSPKTSQ